MLRSTAPVDAPAEDPTFLSTRIYVCMQIDIYIYKYIDIDTDLDVDVCIYIYIQHARL